MSILRKDFKLLNMDDWIIGRTLGLINCRNTHWILCIILTASRFSSIPFSCSSTSSCFWAAEFIRFLTLICHHAAKVAGVAEAGTPVFYLRQVFTSEVYKKRCEIRKLGTRRTFYLLIRYMERNNYMTRSLYLFLDMHFSTWRFDGVVPHES